MLTQLKIQTSSELMPFIQSCHEYVTQQGAGHLFVNIYEKHEDPADFLEKLTKLNDGDLVVFTTFSAAVTNEINLIEGYDLDYLLKTEEVLQFFHHTSLVDFKRYERIFNLDSYQGAYTVFIAKKHVFAIQDTTLPEDAISSYTDKAKDIPHSNNTFGDNHEYWTYSHTGLEQAFKLLQQELPNTAGENLPLNKITENLNLSKEASKKEVVAQSMTSINKMLVEENLKTVPDTAVDKINLTDLSLLQKPLGTTPVKAKKRLNYHLEHPMHNYAQHADLTNKFKKNIDDDDIDELGTHLETDAPAETIAASSFEPEKLSENDLIVADNFFNKVRGLESGLKASYDSTVEQKHVLSVLFKDAETQPEKLEEYKVEAKNFKASLKSQETMLDTLEDNLLNYSCKESQSEQQNYQALVSKQRSSLKTQLKSLEEQDDMLDSMMDT